MSVIVPAHNEAAGIGRLLSALTDSDGTDDGVEVLVVCNGCTDATAEVARAWEPRVRVLDIHEASKQAALASGNAAASHPTRVYCDADVLIDRAGVRRLVGPLAQGVLATAPRRRIETAGASWPVRAYYRFWTSLPQVRSDIFGRGVIALSAEGVERVISLPRVMSDDLAISEAFTVEERRLVLDAESLIVSPRNLGDLLRRRTRIATGNAELDRLGLRTPTARTRVATIVSLVADDPRRCVDAGVFVLVTALARANALARRLRGTSGVWLRDESSRRDA